MPELPRQGFCSTELAQRLKTIPTQMLVKYAHLRAILAVQCAPDPVILMKSLLGACDTIHPPPYPPRPLHPLCQPLTCPLL